MSQFASLEGTGRFGSKGDVEDETPSEWQSIAKMGESGGRSGSRSTGTGARKHPRQRRWARWQIDTKDKPEMLTMKRVVKARTMLLVGMAQTVIYGSCWWLLLATDQKSDFEETRILYLTYLIDERKEKNQESITFLPLTPYTI